MFKLRRGEGAMNLLTAILTSYIVTLVITKGHIFLPFRKMFRRIMWRTPLQNMLVIRHLNVPFEKELQEDDPPEDINDYNIVGWDFPSCRLCVGFYITITTCLLLHIPLEQWLMVYGASYFMATQERS